MSGKIETWLARPVSYSQLASWEWNRREWYKKYIEGIDPPTTEAMLYGNTVGDTLGTPKSLVPALKDIAGIKEYELKATVGDMTLVGYADHYCPKTIVLTENKTSANPTRWTQKSVDEHVQLTMYAMLLYLQNKVKPEDLTIQLNAIPVGGEPLCITGEHRTFTTKRTLADILRYAHYVEKTRLAQIEYVRNRYARN